MKQLTLMSIIVCFLFACKKEADIKRKMLNTEAFHEIELNDAFDVFLTEGNAYSVEIVGDEKIIEHVEAKVRDSILRIENDRKVKWRTPTNNKIELYITAPALEKVSATEGCDIRTMNAITTHDFGLILSGKANEATLELGGNTFFYWNNFPTGGKLTLFGEIEELKLWNVALMSIDAKNLTTSYALVENSSKGDCEINVLDRLDYSIRGEGNIQLYGQPAEINANELSSSGRLIQH